MIREPIPALTFNPDTHEYRYRGFVAPSVTTVLGGVLGNGYRSQAVEAGMMRGRAVHLATQYFDEGRLDPKSVDDIVGPYLTAYMSFLIDVKPKIIRVEQPVYHPLWDFAGTLDRVVEINGIEGVLDIKSGSAPIHTGPQTAAYYEAMSILRGMTGGRWSLVLKPDATYRLTRHQDPSDWEVFKAALCIYRWKEKPK